MMTELNGPTLPTTPTAEQQAEFQKMEALSDAEFDREYILDAAVTKQAGGPIDRGANDVTMAQANLDLNREESSMPLRDDMSHKVQRQQPSDDSDISIGFHVPLLRPIVVRGGGNFP